MEKNSEKPKNISKKRAVIIVVIAVAAAVLAFAAVPRFLNGEESVEFKEVEDNKIPADISEEVVPEYKTLERALACISEIGRAHV